MQTKRLAFLAAIITASSFSFGAYATSVVYTQSPNATFADTSAVKNVSGDPGFTWSLNQDEETWVYFNVATDISFNRISWYGSDTDGKFAVDFYSATCSSCGINWVNTDGHFTNSLLPNPGPFFQPQVHKTHIENGLYSYYIDLTSTLTLDHNNPYYALSVVNNYTSLPFLWAGSDTGSGSHYRYIRGNPVVQSAPGNLAFTLSDTTAPTVPIPASVWLMSSGLVGLLGVARKRKTA